MGDFYLFLFHCMMKGGWYLSVPSMIVQLNSHIRFGVGLDVLQRSLPVPTFLII